MTDVEREIDRAHQLPDQPAWQPPVRNLARLIADRGRDRETADHEYLCFFDDDTSTESRWSYRDLQDAVSRTVTLLVDHGIGQGDRVAFLVGNLDHTVVLYLATWAIGACAAPINAAETFDRKEFILDNSTARLFFARSQYLNEARRLAEPRDLELIEVAPEKHEAYPELARNLKPFDLAELDYDAVGTEALLVYTSGTTGPPKGVRIDQRNLLADADALAKFHGWDASLRTMCVLPIHHVNGIVVTLMSALYVGGTAILNGRFNSGSFWQRVEAERVTIVSVVPTLLEFLSEAGSTDRDTSSLRTIICGAGPLLVETAVEFEERFSIPITHGYGLSETTCYNCHLPPDLSDAARRSWLSDHGFPSIGVALPHQEIAILAADGTPVAGDERGEICIRGDVISLGYHNRDDANADVFKRGWFHSGDEGFALEDEGGREFLFITGRLKELIIRGGVNYSPLEIDEVLNSHPDVRYALAVPFANRYYGDEVAAYVVPREGVELDTEALLAHCREHLDFAKTPKVVVTGDDIPYTTTGKPKRIELARMLEGQLSEYRDTQFRKPRS